MMKRSIALMFAAGTLFLAGYCTSLHAQDTNVNSNTNTPDGGFAVAIAANLGKMPYKDASDAVNKIADQNRKLVAKLVEEIRQSGFPPDSKLCAIYLLGQLRPKDINAAQVLVDNIDFVAQQQDLRLNIARWGMYPAEEALSKIGMPAVEAILDIYLPKESNQLRLNLMCAVLQDVLGKEIGIIIVKQRLDKESDPLGKAHFELALKRLEM